MVDSVESNGIHWRFLSASGRTLLPNLMFDVGATIGVYLALAPHYPASSLVPLLAASMVPVCGIAFNLMKKRRVDIIGVIVLVGILASVAAAAFGGGQRLLLLRESFSTGAIGLALVVSPICPKGIGYYVVRHFMSAHETPHGVSFERLYESRAFRRALAELTFFWGVLLLVECGARVFLALTFPVAFVVWFSPLAFNALMLAGGVASAVWLGRAIRNA